ncbi:MAG: SusC/RagA family TonB-linked outer membrane protein [Adhaeribacter sp.]
MKKFTNGWPYLACLLLLAGPGQEATASSSVAAARAAVRLVDWEITGKVVSERGEALPGVTVLLKGGSVGATTDANGNFSLRVPETAGTLIFSYIGSLTKEVAFSGAGAINVTLSDDAKALQEVVVVGYGTMKKSSVTAAVAKIENKILDQVPAGRPETALVGRLAGVNIAQTRSTPGAAPLIRIRGAGSIDAGNDPLVVIDGFPGGSLGQINMNDVESIEVLKDASSAAIYGSRAAGGVIIVTTKKGQTGKPKLNFNTYYGVSKPMLHDDWVTGEEYYNYVVKYQNREFAWAGGDPSIPVWSDPRRPAQYQVNPIIKEEPQTIWQDEVLQRAPIQSYNFSVSGGTDAVKYYVSATHNGEEGILKTASYKFYGVRANVDVKVNKVINMGFLLNPSYAKRRDAGSLMVSLVKYPPFVAPRNPDGTYPKARDYWGQNVTSQANPNGILNGTFNTSSALNNVGEAYLGLELLKGLNFRTSVGTNISSGSSDYFQASYATNSGSTSGSASDFRTINLLNENTLNYNRTFKDIHEVSGLLGASYQQSTSRSTSLAAVPGSFNNDIIHTLNNAIINPAGTSSYREGWGLVSYFSRLHYAFKEKYLLSGSLRADGSSRFAPDNKWGYFPSASVGWRVSQENFMQNIPAISELKLRGSYGATGNFNIGNFSYLGGITSVNYSPNNVFSKGMAQTSFGNDKLKWEKTNSYDFGVELGLFQNRINMVLDFYDKTTTDQLYNVAIPAITGFTGTLSNIGEIRNKGVELELNTKNLTGDFKWSTFFNVSRNRNEVVSLGGLQERTVTDTYGMSWLLRVGEPMFSYYGYKTIGVLQNAEEIKNTPVLAGSKPGNPKYQDVNGDNKIDPQDRVILGNFQPKLFLGMSNDFAWKNFDLNITMQASLGAKMYTFENQSYQGNVLGAMRRSLVETQWWSPVEPGDGKMPAAALSQLNFQGASDIYIENASFLSVRNLNLGYTLPVGIAEKFRMNSLRVYTSINNLLMVTDKNFHGYNPEGYTAGEIGGVNSMPGYNGNGSEPINRVFTVGLNVSF